MKKPFAAITGVHGWVPSEVVTNKDLEKLVDTTDEWITSRTGIKERRILRDPKLATAHIGAMAVRGLLEKTKTKPSEVDLLICCTVTPDHIFPATANIICDMVGIKSVGSYDISAACSGFLFGLTTAAQFIASGLFKKVIVVGADKMSSILNYEDRTTCIIFGDGGGAVLLEPSLNETGIIDTIMCSDGSGKEFLRQQAGGSLNPATHETVDKKEHFVYQEGKTVFKFAVTNMAQVAADLMERNNLLAKDVDWLVPHQANKRIIDATAERMGVGSNKVMMNIERYGNTTNGTIPLLLWEYENQLKKGDNLVLAAFGGGFTWGSTLIKWSYDSKL